MNDLSIIRWNWQQPDWPVFTYDAQRLASAEAEFLKQGGVLMGAFRHLRLDDERELTAELLTSEAMTTSAIEGEILDRASVRASIMQNLGLTADARRIGPRELGIAQMTTDAMRTFRSALTHETLFGWHKMVMQGRADVEQVGAYRTHLEPLQVESGPADRKSVHFVAPPPAKCPARWSSFYRGSMGPERSCRPWPAPVSRICTSRASIHLRTAMAA